MTGADLIALLKKNPIGAAGLLVALVCGAVIYLRGDTITAAQTAFDDKAREAQKMATNIRNGADLETQVEALEVAARELESRLVTASQLANNLQIFYRIENETGIKLLDTPRQGPLPAVPPGGAQRAYVGVPFTVNVRSSFPEIMTFVRRLEAGAQFCRFGSVSLSRAGSNLDSGGGASAPAMTATVSFEFLGQP